MGKKGSEKKESKTGQRQNGEKSMGSVGGKDKRKGVEKLSASHTNANVTPIAIPEAHTEHTKLTHTSNLPRRQRKKEGNGITQPIVSKPMTKKPTATLQHTHTRSWTDTFRHGQTHTHRLAFYLLHSLHSFSQNSTSETHRLFRNGRTERGQDGFCYGHE